MYTLYYATFLFLKWSFTLRPRAHTLENTRNTVSMCMSDAAAARRQILVATILDPVSHAINKSLMEEKSERRMSEEKKKKMGSGNGGGNNVLSCGAFAAHMQHRVGCCCCCPASSSPSRECNSTTVVERATRVCVASSSYLT